MTKNTKKSLRKAIRKVPYLLIILLAIAAVSIIVKPTQAKSSTVANYQVVVVRDGETLWQIAKSHNNESDIREFIHQIKKLNKLEHSLIYPGQKIMIPIEE